MTDKLNVGPLKTADNEDQIKMALKHAVEKGWDSVSITAEGDVVEHLGEPDDGSCDECDNNVFDVPPMMGPGGPTVRVSFRPDGGLKLHKVT